MTVVRRCRAIYDTANIRITPSPPWPAGVITDRAAVFLSLFRSRAAALDIYEHMCVSYIHIHSCMCYMRIWARSGLLQRSTCKNPKCT